MKYSRFRSLVYPVSALLMALSLALISLPAWAVGPTVTNVQAHQWQDDLRKVQITYYLTDPDTASVYVSVAISNDGGSTYSITPTTLTGDIGWVRTGGTRTIIWDAKADYPTAVWASCKAKVTADDTSGGVYPGQMVYIPAGSFLMGNSGVNYDRVFKDCSELPQHSVFLPGYWIGKYEVTRGEYRKFMDAGGYSDPHYWSSDGWNWKVANGRTQPDWWAAYQWCCTGCCWPCPPMPFTQTDNHPVAGVSYYEAEAFCNWAGGHLPTEAQWEKAARWTGSHLWASVNVYPWGKFWDWRKCNNFWVVYYPPYQYPQTVPVWRYPACASPCGCLNMAGNVWEWCQDWYVSYPGSTCPFDYTNSRRVRRGGGFSSDERTCRCAYRDHDYPYSSWHDCCYDVGFRLARSLPKPVVVLVRGLQFAGSQSADGYWAHARSALAGDFDVWVCDTISGKENVTVAAVGLRQFIQGKLAVRAQLGLPPPKSISILAHSYGGLIARKYIHDYPGDPKIDKVIMLSTPNCGSSLADLGTWIGWLPGLGSEAALRCLTTDFVQEHFNKTCPALPPPVPFYLFGAYGGENGCLYWWPNGTVNPNDGAVTACSAQGWRWRRTSWWIDPFPTYACERQVGSVCKRTTPDNHSTITTNAYGTLDLVRKILLGESIGCEAPTPPCVQMGALRTVGAGDADPSCLVAMADGTIFQDQTSDASVTVDDCPQAHFALDYAAGDLTFTLTTPTGGTIDPTSPDPSVHYSKTADEGGIHESYLIDSPELGAWMVNLTGAAVDPAGAPWSLMVSEESNLGLTSTTEYFQSAGNVIVSASATDGSQPITGAAVSADVRRPDDTVDQLTLYDDGAHADGAANDGLYANAYAASTEPGIYRVRYSATGTNLQGHAFSRIEGDTFQIAPQTAALSGVYSDHGEDTGPPPGIENVVVDAGIQVLCEGNYAVSAKLADAQGNPLVAVSASATGLPVGPATISLRFDADALRRSGVNGPYTLTDVELWDESGEMPLRADHVDSPYTTGPYQCSEFSDQCPPNPVQDLTVSGVDPVSASVTLRWTAPSSEGAAAASYDVRYYAAGLNSELWDSATVVSDPPGPVAPGVVQTLAVSPLPLGQTYFFGLKSRDQVGNESQLSNTADVYLGSQLDMRNSPDGTYGAAMGVVAATSDDVGAPYVESEGRAWGVRVDGTPATESHRVYVTGFLSRQSGEPTMTAASIHDLGAGTPIQPVAVSGINLGPPADAQGLDNIGLLVTIWGMVTQKGDGYLYLDDGAALRDGTLTGEEENIGVRVICDPNGYSAGDYLFVTGISSCFETPSSQIARRILTRKPEDIRKVYP